MQYMNARFGERKMKKGQGLDSLKAIVLGVIVMVFLTHSFGMGRAISLSLPLLPNAEVSSEFTLIETSLEEVRPQLAIDFTNLGLVDTEAHGLIQNSPPSLNLKNSQLSLVTPPTSSLGSKRNNSAFFITAVSSTVILQAADYLTTLNAMKYSSLQEGNPLLKNVVHDPLLFGAVKLCVTGLQIVLLKKLHESNRTLGWIVGTALNAAVSYVVANNISKIQRAQNL
jgi:hypothetical protein